MKFITHSDILHATVPHCSEKRLSIVFGHIFRTQTHTEKNCDTGIPLLGLFDLGYSVRRKFERGECHTCCLNETNRMCTEVKVVI